MRFPFLTARRIVLSLLFLGLLGADRVTKILAERTLAFGDSVPLIPGFFQLTRVHNTGMAFGMLDDVAIGSKAWILTGVSAALIGVIVWFAVKAGPLSRWTAAGLTLMLAGALGNMWDRIAYGHVVDFLDAYIGEAHWPVFNIADATICAGVGLLILESVAEFRGAPSPPGGPSDVAASGAS